MEYKTIVPRWRFGRPMIGSKTEKTLAHVVERLAVLEQVLDKLQAAIEYPRPSVEDRIAASSNTAVTSTTFADINGVSLSFEAEVDCSLVADGNFDVECSVFGSAAHAFLGRLEVDAVAQTPLAVSTAAAAGDRRSVTQTWVVTGLKAGTTYQIKMRGATSNAGTTWNVFSAHTGLCVQVVPVVFTP